MIFADFPSPFTIETTTEWPDPIRGETELVYSAEDAYMRSCAVSDLRDAYRKLRSIDDAQAYVWDLAQTKWWSDLDLPLPPRVISCRSSVYSHAHSRRKLEDSRLIGGTIRLRSQHFVPHIVIHELAHSVLPKNLHHGLRWRIAQLTLMWHAQGSSYAMQLACEYMKKGLL